ncbi:hypothetical protein EI427_22230 [Flammeovirga pectinis]|uniref:Lipocalin-like domain-containing protein n=1 Tax=Flammeovirga pectinis TaxID=2494373 RepID=A0A3Q9FTV9_9BACT|nr:hypothetical protein [Flammeovirga pectinis]AZQ64946.1 hypothetical protein EI427_22230 [Flammeovirga pectinis]
MVKSENENSIVGTWQRIQRYDGGSPDKLLEVEDGRIMSFSKDGKFSGELYQCDGAYKQSLSIISLTLPCRTESNSFASDEIEYEYSLDNNELKITPVESTCIEGCYFIYIRIL